MFSSVNPTEQRKKTGKKFEQNFKVEPKHAKFFAEQFSWVFRRRRRRRRPLRRSGDLDQKFRFSMDSLILNQDSKLERRVDISDEFFMGRESSMDGRGACTLKILKKSCLGETLKVAI